MSRSILHVLKRGIEYGALPFQYPEHFWELWLLLFRNRALLYELPALTEYRSWLQARGIQTVIDVGAYLGAFSWGMRMILPEAQIYAFEALEENYHRLRKHLEPKGRFQAFLTALGEKSGMLEFYRSSFAASSSPLPMGDLHRHIFPQSAHQEKLLVAQARLDDYLDRMELRAPTLLKLDVQGYELNVLRGAAQTLQRVDWLICEVSFCELYIGQPLFEAIYAWLTERGFRYAGSMGKLLSPVDGSILQEDALFVRK
uniref:Hypothetical conserved protein n=1 Tax=uncultured Chloroflexota bacterium TaxID=166587 RepID=H5SL35_9CHLR|nr:hypothetical conserved protein [uncultured Chloroflexota bacterium]